ncbi:hypothetical protein [Pseudarthrobacter sp. MEB009]|uniref:hypothetical protein n=1 Tax=Pseudarthrobacter sp. MEB009 TaxID=3040326 RepID=UPI0025534269|nr:hypothetical protein [Pseudarthrobacter sp. MEB009]
MDATDDPSGLAAVAAARDQLDIARRNLREAVDTARRDYTWAEIGGVLGMSRQAAFKRFGSARDPRTGETMQAGMKAMDVAARTEQVFRLVDSGDYGSLAPMLTDDAAAVLTRGRVLGTWAQAVADTGNLVSFHGTGVELPDGSALSPGEEATGTLVGHTMIDCEAGQWVGRVAFNAAGLITGLLIVPTQHGELPF